MSDALDNLGAAAAACRRCPRMAGRRRVLSRANGSPGARVIFVAEAPGRFGGDRTGVPLSADRTGRNFAALLDAIGWTRDEVFITNAVLCNPRDERGRNDRPHPAEIANCSGWLRATIDIVGAPFVVSLGAVALAALDRIEPHGLRLRDHVARPAPWFGRTLIPLYHPGDQARITRPAADQMHDWQALRRIVDESEAGDPAGQRTNSRI